MSKTGHSSHDGLRDAIHGAFEAMPADAKASTRHRVLVEASYTANPGRIRLAFARSAATFTTVAVLLTGTSYAAATAVPGDALYPVKRAVEEVHVALAPGGSENALVRQTQTRAEEVRRLMEMDAPEAIIDQAAMGFGEAATRAVKQAESPEDAQRTVRKIEEGVAGQPPQVQQRVEEALPPGPGPGDSDGAPQSPAEDAPGTQGPGSGSGSEGGSSQGEQPGPGESQGSNP
jgi:hypothetical protein